jgi:hypothetical protein
MQDGRPDPDSPKSVAVIRVVAVLGMWTRLVKLDGYLILGVGLAELGVEIAVITMAFKNQSGEVVEKKWVSWKIPVCSSC